MDKIQFNLFDIFGNVLPGFVLLITFSLLFQGLPFEVDSIDSVFKEMDIKSSVLILLTSYILGFMAQFFSAKIFKSLIPFLTKNNNGSKVDYSIGKRGIELSMIRHKSPNNYTIIERFLVLRIFCYNMFFALIIAVLGFSTSLFYCSIQYDLLDYFFIPICLFFAFIFIRRATAFLLYVHGVMDDVISSEVCN